MMSQVSNTVLIFGCGYSAQVLGQQLLAKGWRVLGTTRSSIKADAMRAQGIQPILWPGDDIMDALDAATHILISAAPNETGDPVLTALSVEIQRRAGQYAWLGYLSTTAVYGDRNGGWVDETSTLNPATKRGAARVVAERAWLQLHHSHALPVHIFRLAGIYGPNRGPIAKLRAGTARCIIKKGQVFSRIHVADIAQVLQASISQPNPGAIYNVCDNKPTSPEVVIAYAAKILGLPVPAFEPFEQAKMTPMARSFYGESKKVSNRRILEELGVTLQHPDYKSGLDAEIAAKFT